MNSKVEITTLKKNYTLKYFSFSKIRDNTVPPRTIDPSGRGHTSSFPR